MKFGAVISDAEGLRLSPEEKALFKETNPFGFILFARNIETPDQVRALCDDFRDAVGRNCLITIDQEGGRVQRLRAPIAREWMPPLDHTEKAAENAERAMYLRYRLIAEELWSLGIDSNCAPMVDIARDATHPFLRNRCYAKSADKAAQIGRAVAQGHLDGGVLPIAKHIPGHGLATLDSHYDLPHVDLPLAELQQADFAPFRMLNDLPMGMTAHLVFDQIDPQAATISATVMNLIRDDIGFGGLIMTDDISMKALSGSLTDLSKTALNAGCDVILHCNGSFAERAEVLEAAGEMTEIAQRRAENALSMRQKPLELDIKAAEAELSRLMGGQVYER
ncbi:MAG: beta-N-acetylhexosaminidase [Ruegeria sp.]